MNKKPNHLINETSPYLLQHAWNPVDWYPWGLEALQLAKHENKPILLSVGYSACHWCHVMEKESFENTQIAQIMNNYFICVKVDREERPDLDNIYMSAIQTMTGQGGWPMTVFLTPDAKPFYGGTYFPPEDRHGLPGFPKVLLAIANLYKHDIEKVISSSTQITQRIEDIHDTYSPIKKRDFLNSDLLSKSYDGILSTFDEIHGGTGIQPKFPQPMTHEFVLRYYLISKDPAVLRIVNLTLTKMAQGGIFDQVGGGFHRYSTDRLWLVPHFEKMLYDNALLAKLYLHAYQVTQNPLYRRIVEETLSYISQELTDICGGFYSSQDADSEGIEGKFFVWKPTEIIEILGETEGRLVNDFFGVTDSGNFEGFNILHVTKTLSIFSKENGIDEESLKTILLKAKSKLLEARNLRVKPTRDEKILTSWNALMLHAYAEAGVVLDKPEYIDIAKRNAKFILSKLYKGNRLLHSYKDGKAKLNGYLEDYAFFIDGLISLHEATFEIHWIDTAIKLAEIMIDLFWENESGQWFDTSHDHEKLIVRPRDISDNATPSGSSMASDVMLKLSIMTGKSEFENIAISAIEFAGDLIAKFPTASSHWLCALDFYLSETKELAIFGNRWDANTQDMLRRIHAQYLPNRVILSKLDNEEILTEIPLFNNRAKLNNQTTVYVCQNYICKLPVTQPEELSKQLDLN